MHQAPRVPESGLMVFAVTLALTIVFLVVLVMLHFVTIIIPTIIPMLMAILMLGLITRHVFALIPAVLHKIDTFAAGVIFPAMLTPVFCAAVA